MTGKIISDCLKTEGAEAASLLVRDLILGATTIGSIEKPLELLPEDLVIDVLKHDRPSSMVWQATVRGCALAMAELLHSLAVGEGGDTFAVALVRACRVLDMAGPDELRGHAEALLRLSVASTDGDIVSAVARAAARYASDATAIPLWQELLARREVAAYAFMVLVKIDSERSATVNALVQIWKRVVREAWTVDCAYLAKRMVRLHGDERSLRRVLGTLARELDGEEVSQIEGQLERRSWSREWIDFLSDGVQWSFAKAGLSMTIHPESLRDWRGAEAVRTVGYRGLAEPSWPEAVDKLIAARHEPLTYLSASRVRAATRAASSRELEWH